MAKTLIDGIGQFYQHYPHITVVVTSHTRGKDNAMAVAWHCPLSRVPPLYGVAIASKRLTYEYIVESGEFGVNFVPHERAEIIASVGGITGREVDKLERFGLAKEPPARTSVPVLKDAYTTFECKLVEQKTYGDHEWLVGEIVAIHIFEGAFDEGEVLDLDKVSPTLYLGADLYVTTHKDTARFLDRKVYGQR